MLINNIFTTIREKIIKTDKFITKKQICLLLKYLSNSTVFIFSLHEIETLY